MVFEYLDAFDPDQNDLAELKAHYQRGGIADKTIKTRLCDILIAHFEPIYKRRCQYQHHPSKLYEILIHSSQTARAIAADTLSQVRRCLYPLHTEIEMFSR